MPEMAPRAKALRVQTPDAGGQAFPDGRTAKLSVREVFPEYIIVRGEYSLSVKKPGEDALPFDAARLAVDYVFRKSLPGVVAVETLKADKPMYFGGWSYHEVPGLFVNGCWCCHTGT